MPGEIRYVGRPPQGLYVKHGQPVYYPTGKAPNWGVLRADGSIQRRSAYPNSYDIVPSDNPPGYTSSAGAAFSLGPNYGLSIGATTALLSFTDERANPYHGWAISLNPANGALGSPFGSPDLTYGKPDGYGYMLCWSPTLARYFGVPADGASASGGLVMFNESGTGWPQGTAVPNNPEAMFCTPTQLVLFNSGVFYTTPLSGFTNRSGSNAQSWTTNNQSSVLANLCDIDYDYASNTWCAICGSGTTYQIKQSTDMAAWTTVATLALASAAGSTYISCNAGEWFAWQNGTTTPIYHSTDGGNTFAPLCTPTSNLALAIICADEGGYTFLTTSMTYAQKVTGGAYPSSFTALLAGSCPAPRCGFKPRYCSWTGTICGAANGPNNYLYGWSLNLFTTFTAPTLPSLDGYDGYVKV